jgi:uncharacterized protein YndB with AHSA1/START domain
MTDDKHAEAPESIEFQCELPDPPEKVWRALTVPDLLAAWMMPNDIKPEPAAALPLPGRMQPSNAKYSKPSPDACCAIPGGSGRSQAMQPRRDPLDSPLDSIVTFTLDRTISGGTHLRIVHGGFARATMPAVAMSSAGCRLSLNSHKPNVKQTIPANTPRLLLRAA